MTVNICALSETDSARRRENPNTLKPERSGTIAPLFLFETLSNDPLNARQMDELRHRRGELGSFTIVVCDVVVFPVVWIANRARKYRPNSGAIQTPTPTLGRLILGELILTSTSATTFSGGNLEGV
eukprot:366335-Prorocentrum_minimum.AAC.1